ncbi:hypothetical protein FACS1894211_10390 [Clostridia bacterium]|nr:hypothetical protein FACS1894211_10390 [Clostridia bacterium]
MIIFSERLKELRILEGYSQKQMAEKLCLRQQSYLRYENNGEPSLSTLAKIAKLFDVSTDYLLGLKDEY